MSSNRDALESVTADYLRVNDYTLEDRIEMALDEYCLVIFWGTGWPYDGIIMTRMQING